jgi:hypothetical protein
MMIYRGKLVSGPAALPRLLLRDLIYEKVLVGPVVPDFHGPVARLVELATGGCRIDWWVKGTGWVEAPKGAFGLADFMPGYTRPASAKDAALLDIPASELDDIAPWEIELEKHEMRRPRNLRLHLGDGTAVAAGPRQNCPHAQRTKLGSSCRPGAAWPRLISARRGRSPNDHHHDSADTLRGHARDTLIINMPPACVYSAGDGNGKNRASNRLSS